MVYLSSSSLLVFKKSINKKKELVPTKTLIVVFDMYANITEQFYWWQRHLCIWSGTSQLALVVSNSDCVFTVSSVNTNMKIWRIKELHIFNTFNFMYPHLLDSVTKDCLCLECFFVFPNLISIAEKWFCTAKPSSGASPSCTWNKEDGNIRHKFWEN